MSAPSTSKPVLIVLSFLTAMQIFNGGLAALEVLPLKTVGIIALATAAVSAGVGFYLQGKVVPLEAVAARVTGDGLLVSGPADQTIPTGTQVELSPASHLPDGNPYSSH